MLCYVILCYVMLFTIPSSRLSSLSILFYILFYFLFLLLSYTLSHILFSLNFSSSSSSGIFFDNFVVAHSLKEAFGFADATYTLKAAGNAHAHAMSFPALPFHTLSFLTLPFS